MRTKGEVGFDSLKTPRKPTFGRVEVETGFSLKEPSRKVVNSTLKEEYEKIYKEWYIENPIQIGGRLQAYQENWKRIVNDQWATQVVEEGLRLDFEEIPVWKEIEQFHLTEKDQRFWTKKFKN
jgi:hypothetical protein